MGVGIQVMLQPLNKKLSNGLIVGIIQRYLATIHKVGSPHKSHFSTILMMKLCAEIPTFWFFNAKAPSKAILIFPFEFKPQVVQ